jgi:calcineurin-like phosphoesterase family protein
MKTFFIADTHFDHAKFYDPQVTRPFTMDEWNKMLIDRINTMATRADRLFILGDFAWKRPGYWRQQIRCRNVVLILGNHDSEAKCRNVFGGNLYDTRVVKNVCGSARVFLSHYPHAHWPASHHGSLHLYGHCHNQREACLDAIWPERRSMDVSPDTAYALTGEWRPFTDEEIVERLMQREGHDSIQFYKDYQSRLEF